MWLTGIGLVFQIIFYIIVGAGCILFAIFGGAHYISTMMTHDKKCSCNQCQARRQKAWRKAHNAPLDVVIPKAQDHYADKGGVETWISTVELEIGMRVLGKGSGSIYKVEEVAAREYGFVVVLVNELTKAKSWIRISTATAHKKVWLMRPTRKRK